MTSLPHPVTEVRAIAVRPGRHLELPERLVTEDPMEIRAAGPGQEPMPVAVTMRTPGHDFELAVGFLVTEGLAGPDEVAAVAYCDLAGDGAGAETPAAGRYNAVTVSLRRLWDPAQVQRNFVAGSSCGICGKASIDQVELSCRAVPPGGRIPASLIATLPDRLRRSQRIFDRTGGLHAAGLFDRHGSLICGREDIGRHNAVDKVIGHGALARVAVPPDAMLMVSGRVSFEIVQKAAMGRIGLIAAVSAPSSLAVDAARRLGVTVAGFVRNGTYNLYSHPERVELDR